MVINKFVSAKLIGKLLSLIMFSLFLVAVLIFLSCKKKNDDKAKYVTLQFEKMWIGRTTGKFFEVNIDLNDKSFSRVKEISSVPRYAESAYQSGALKDDVISIIGTTAEPVNVIDTSPDGRWTSVRAKVFLPDNGKGAKFEVYLLNTKHREVCQKIGLSDAMYFTSDSNGCIFNQVLDLNKMSLPSFERTKLCEVSTFVMLPDRKKLLVFRDQKILLTDMEGNVDSTIGKYFLLARSAGLINNEWAYLVTNFGPKKEGGKLYLINLQRYEVVAYPYPFYDSQLMNVVKPVY
jgi:hypothetical protein